MPITFQKLQDDIHVLYENATDTPAVGDEDFDIRQTLINQAIKEWEIHEGMLWNELWTTWTYTTVSDSVTIPLPTDFLYFAGGVLVNGYSYNVIRPEQKTEYQESDYVCWVTGKTGAKSLRFLTTVATGTSIEADYYKEALISDDEVTISEVPDMAQPLFIEYWVLAELHASDNNTAGYNRAKQEADKYLSYMVIKNAQNPPYQPNNLPDLLTMPFGV